MTLLLPSVGDGVFAGAPASERPPLGAGQAAVRLLRKLSVDAHVTVIATDDRLSPAAVICAPAVRLDTLARSDRFEACDNGALVSGCAAVATGPLEADNVAAKETGAIALAVAD